MSNSSADSPARYYQKTKKRFRKSLVKDIKILLKKRKTKNKISLKLKNKD